jgi:hypothetical protein
MGGSAENQLHARVDVRKCGVGSGKYTGNTIKGFAFRQAASKVERAWMFARDEALSGEGRAVDNPDPVIRKAREEATSTALIVNVVTPCAF